jgi:hypothetical protein
MSHLRSTILAAALVVATAGFSGYIASASAEPVNPPSAKVYADSTDSSGRFSMTLTQADEAKPQNKNVWESQMISAGSTACDLRCRTGFFGYR